MSGMKTAVIFEDHKLFSDVFSMSLERIGYFSNVVVFDRETELIGYLTTHQSMQIYLFMDFFLPESNTFYLIGDVRRFCPSVAIFVVSSVSSSILVKKILSLKIDGFVSKVDGIDQIVACVHSHARKNIHLSPTIKQIIEHQESEGQLSGLTARELEILSLIAKGLNVSQIAEHLGLSRHTVLVHRKNMLAKSNHCTFAELVAKALNAGLFPARL
jgi:DNA-binding NarL/FixJ family response regulator